MKGIVKFYDTKKAYGFIVPEDGGKDIFVHITGIKKENPPWGMDKFAGLQEGQQVEFDMGSNRQGPCAINVKVVDNHG